MLLYLTKVNCVATNEKKIFLNDRVISHFYLFSKIASDGSEIALTDGTIIHVREKPDEISEMMLTEVVCPGRTKIDPGVGDARSAVPNGKQSTNGKELGEDINNEHVSEAA